MRNKIDFTRWEVKGIPDSIYRLHTYGGFSCHSNGYAFVKSIAVILGNDSRYIDRSIDGGKSWVAVDLLLDLIRP